MFSGQDDRDFEQAALPRDVRPPAQGRAQGGHDLPPPPAGEDPEAPAGAHPHPAQEDTWYVSIQRSPTCPVAVSTLDEGGVFLSISGVWYFSCATLVCRPPRRRCQGYHPCLAKHPTKTSDRGGGGVGMYLSMLRPAGGAIRVACFFGIRFCLTRCHTLVVANNGLGQPTPFAEPVSHEEFPLTFL